jgi:hypothetical protein
MSGEQIVARDLSMGSGHLVQLFDSNESLVEAVSDFLHEGLVSGDSVLAVMDERRWYLLAMRLTARGADVDGASRAGRLVVRDAADTLSLLMRDGRPDADLFEMVAGSVVRGLVRGRRRLRVYGEMVDILASHGDFGAAQALEELWNGLARQVAFTLFCGYTSAHFGDPRSAGALRRICETHSGVRMNPDDVLGSFLLTANAACPAR